MRQLIHYHYYQLDGDETAFVDEAFRDVYRLAKHHNVKLAGNDIIERAVNALARAVIESRPKPKPRVRVKAGRDPLVVAREELAREGGDI